MPNAPTGDESQTGGPPAEMKYLTAEEATALIGTVVNQAITAHDKRNATKRNDEFRKILAEEIGKTQKPADDAGSSGAPPPDKKTDPEVLAMKRRLEEMQAAVKATEERANAAERKQREERTRTDLIGRLDTVRPELKPFLSDYLFHRVEFDDEGTALLKTGDDALPLADGIAAFLKSKEAAAFLPAPTDKKPQGGKLPSGPPQRKPATPPGYTTEAVSDEEKIARAMEREQAYLQQQGQ